MHPEWGVDPSKIFGTYYMLAGLYLVIPNHDSTQVASRSAYLSMALSGE